MTDHDVGCAMHTFSDDEKWSNENGVHATPYTCR
jgi:hypothetical protein